MKRTLFPIIAISLLFMTACSDTEKKLQQRAFELCSYIPDYQQLEKSRDYLTTDFYSVLDTLFYRLPEHEAMDHEWLHFFVTAYDDPISDYDVAGVEKTDRTHAVATINVRQVWEEGSFDEETDIEQHRLFMEKVNGQWLMSDFDGHKEDCIHHIAINRREQAVRKGISDYLLNEIAPYYRKGELCIPTLMIVNEENDQVWGDFWVFWYDTSGDTLKCVSGGNHAGLMTLDYREGTFTVTSFVQVSDGAGYTPSAKRIFRDYYDIFCNMHSNQDVREAVRREQLSEYIKSNGLKFRYYQDYGWPAIQLELNL